ncbi:MAG: hypothetical protein K8R59_05800, partial [Thermoanaerobaculales bacterium]|nr:hypothetical protein [Thermoanaerobaculales bacterium]
MRLSVFHLQWMSTGSGFAAALILISGAGVSVAQTTDPGDKNPTMNRPEEVISPTATPAPDDHEGPGERTWLNAVDIGALEARSSALLLSGQKGGGVEGVLQWTVSPHNGEGPSRDVPFLVEVEGAALLASHEAGRIPLGIYAYVMTLDGKLVAHRAQGLVLDPGRWARHLLVGGLRFFGRLQLQPGMYSLRVMVRNHRTNDYFLTWTEIRIPEPAGEKLALLPPIFWDPSTIWVTALQHDLGEKGAMDAFSGGHLVPAGMAVLPEGKGADFLLVISGAGGVAPQVSARIVDEVGRTVSEPELRLSEDPISVGGMSRYRHATMEAVDLPPGNYKLVVQVETPDEQRALRAVPMMVTAGDQPLAWVQANAAPDIVPKRTISPEEQITKRKIIRREYLAALGLLADGDALKAGRAVADLERRVLAAGKGPLVMALRSIEQGESLKLARKDPLALMPVIDLHRRLYRTYKVRHENRLATHAWMITADLAEVASKYQPKAIPAAFAEQTLVGLASDLVQSSGMASAQTLLDRCLRITPSYEAALLALGAAHERLGVYDEAARALRHLIKA